LPFTITAKSSLVGRLVAAPTLPPPTGFILRVSGALQAARKTPTTNVTAEIFLLKAFKVGSLRLFVGIF
jgi:hypothetical protein